MADASVPQSQPLPGMVPNSAGGYSYQVSDMQRLRRFLCLGSEGGTYYIGEKKLGKENASAILRLISNGKGAEVVKEIVEFSVEGRAAKQNPIIFALALCARDSNLEVKKAAYNALSSVCRIPTHLFTFVEFCEALSQGTGWGRCHREAIKAWYLTKDPKHLAMAVTKYKQRNGWSHLDLLRLSHVKADDPLLQSVFKYIVKGIDVATQEYMGKSEKGDEIILFLRAVDSVLSADEGAAIGLIKQYNLVREHLPTQLLNSKPVWLALLEKMPMTAMIRNLGKMTSIGILDPLSEAAIEVCKRLRDQSALQKARIHPFNVLLAMKIYETGHGDKGKLNWKPNQAIVSALDECFYASFKYVEPTGKRFLLAVDVSGSMGCSVSGSSISCACAAAAMAMVTMKTEQNYHVLGFSTHLVPISINSRMRLDDVMTTIRKINMGGTDCAQPMLWAIKNKTPVDVFIVYTDCETWAGAVHPAEALKKYRKAMGINAKLIVCAMSSNGFTLADPNDPGMLDMAGFDSAAPLVMNNFVMGLI